MITSADVYRSTDRFMAEMRRVGVAASKLAPAFGSAAAASGALAESLGALKQREEGR